MIDFGKYAIVDNAKHTFKDMEDVYWEFRTSTSLDELAMAKFYAERSEDLEGEPDLGQVGPHWIEVMWRELAMLFGGTNLSDSKKKPILKDDAGIDAIESVLKQMPQRMIVELWIALGEAVPGWGPSLPKKESNSEENSED